jgi:hypothetical protein
MADNFDVISLHSLPNPRPPKELWPEMSKKEVAKLVAYSPNFPLSAAGPTL